MNIKVYCTKRFTKMFEKLLVVTQNASRALVYSDRVKRINNETNPRVTNI